MFISLSKMFTLVGGLRFGLGIRITKRNFIWMSLLTCFVCMMQAVLYMLVLCFWLLYAMFYGFAWGIKSVVRLCCRGIRGMVALLAMVTHRNDQGRG